MSSKTLWPDPAFSRGKNTVWVQGIFETFVEPHGSVAAPVIDTGDLVHESNMRPVLAIALTYRSARVTILMIHDQV